MAETVAPQPRAPLDITAVSRRIIANVEQVVVGKRQQIIQVLVAWFCEGHVLEQDVSLAEPSDQDLNDLLTFADDDLLDVRNDPSADGGDVERGARLWSYCLGHTLCSLDE